MGEERKGTAEEMMEGQRIGTEIGGGRGEETEEWRRRSIIGGEECGSEEKQE